MLADNDLTGSGTWDGDRDINVVFLDNDLRDNVGELRSDSGVSSDWGNDSLLDNGISRSWAVVNRCRGDGSIRCLDNREDWRGKRQQAGEWFRVQQQRVQQRHQLERHEQLGHERQRGLGWHEHGGDLSEG